MVTLVPAASTSWPHVSTTQPGSVEVRHFLGVGGNRSVVCFVYKDVTVTVEHDFEATFREVYPRLVSLGVLKTGRLEVARDLAQETMARAHDRWDVLADYDAPAVWCRVVMTNLLVDHHRRTASERNAVERLGRQAAAGESRLLGNGAKPSLDRWNELVRPLPDRQRLAVTLFYADDLSVGQIANLLDTSRGSVKAMLFKARRTLRSRLERVERMEGDTDG